MLNGHGLQAVRLKKDPEKGFSQKIVVGYIFKTGTNSKSGDFAQREDNEDLYPSSE